MSHAEAQEYGDVMTVGDFRAAVNAGGFVDYDGYGYPIKDGIVDEQIVVMPSTSEQTIPKDATHIVWFNR